MKLPKRMLALLLILALGLGLSLTAHAEEPDPAMPVFMLQPQTSVRLRLKTEIILTVSAEIPADNSLVRYQWFFIEPGSFSPVAIEGATDRTFKGKVENYPEHTNFYAVAYNVSDSTATEGPHRAESNLTTLSIYKESENTFLSILFGNLFWYGYAALHYILAFIMFPVIIVQKAFNWFTGLFK